MLSNLRSIVVLASSRSWGGSSFLAGYSSTVPLQPKIARATEIRRNEKGERIFTREEVNTHNTADDCWMILDNKVYNVTAWVDLHPGGDAIGEGAGKDATSLFEFQHHSEHAREILAKYLIGIVDEEPRYTLTQQDRGTQPSEKLRP